MTKLELKRGWLQGNLIRQKRELVKEYDKLADKVGMWAVGFSGSVFLLIWSVYFVLHIY